MYTPSTTSGNSGSVGTGATHTVIVAPTQGVLRYVPFAVNASVGDTIQFMWNANNHTVTKSSELLPCNKTADSPFTSGQQSKGFVFTQVVNSTDPTYFYCGVPSHCQKGMFGIINPPSALSSSTSIFNSMTTLAANVNSTFFVVMVFLLFFPESRPLRDGLLHKSVDSQQQQGCQLGKQYRLGQIA
jgi:plastocyanin